MLKKQLTRAGVEILKATGVPPSLKQLGRPQPLKHAIRVGKIKGWPAAAGWLLSGHGRATLEHPQLHASLRSGINFGIEAELLLTETRRQLLLGPRNLLSRPEVQETVCSIIQQSIINERVWYVSPEERQMLGRLRTEPGLAPWRGLALHAMYERPEQVLADAGVPPSAIPTLDPPETLRRLLADYLEQHVEEMALREQIPRFGVFENETSAMIAQNYEDYPYPRWISMPRPEPESRTAELREFFSASELRFMERPFRVLVAGCGTGNKALNYAIRYGPRAQVLGIDLSRASLAYAQRMARIHGVENIDFLQMDLLSLPRFDGEFDIVECTGVLHHMDDPVAGGRAIVDRVRSGGLVHISLYSKLARRGLADLRRRFDKPVAEVTDDDIRAFRYPLLTQEPELVNRALSLREDFFDLDRCKDLLFHPLEHLFTVPGIGALLDAMGVEFRGLQLPEPVDGQLWTSYPRKPDRRDLDRWRRFEESHPDAFNQLYEIWAVKP